MAPNVRELQEKIQLLERQLEEQSQLREAVAAAQRAIKAKDNFLAVLSHELRTPLTPVLATAAALQSDARVPPWLREDLQMIRRNIELEARLIDDLLDLTRITKGKLDLQLEVVDAHQMIDSVVGICRSEMFGKQVQVTNKLEAKHSNVLADPARLQQIFWNIVKNAIKFTPTGGSVVIRTSNDSTNDELMVEVIDTGIGIRAEMLHRIFDAFEQDEPAVSRVFGGLGLGLAISKALVSMHDGKIGVSSEGPGQGATFVVTLPVAHQPATVMPPPKTTEPVVPRSLSILLVEDHTDTARIMAKLLQSLGHNVKTAATVGAAMELASHHAFDLLISDIGLPDATGLDLVRALQAKHPIQAIALSGFGMEEDIVKSRDAGFQTHLTKPVNFHKLQAVIQRIAIKGKRDGQGSVVRPESQAPAK